MIVGSQLSSRVIYWRLGPRRHLTIGLCGVSLFIALLALMGSDTSLWWARLILFGMGFSMAQVFVPAQAASFATISPADTGRASTLHNVSRQLGGAVGVALLTTTIVIIGPVHHLDGHTVANLTAYRICFLVASASALLGVVWSLTIRDADAAQTMVDPRERKRALNAARAKAAPGLRSRRRTRRAPVSPPRAPARANQRECGSVTISTRGSLSIPA